MYIVGHTAHKKCLKKFLKYKDKKDKNFCPMGCKDIYNKNWEEEEE